MVVPGLMLLLATLLLHRPQAHQGLDLPAGLSRLPTNHIRRRLEQAVLGLLHLDAVAELHVANRRIQKL